MSRFDVIEASLKQLDARVGPIPLAEVTLLRLIHHYSVDVHQRLRQALKPHGLNEWKYRTLVRLQAAGPAGVPMSQLSHIAGETATNMTRICDELVADGWACRVTDPADRRKVLLSILPRAETVLAKVSPDVWRRLEWGMAVLTPQEIAQMIRLMKRLVVRAEAEDQHLRESAGQRSGAAKKSRSKKSSGGQTHGKKTTWR